MTVQREREYEYDLAIVGSGGGAFAAAIAARDRDLRVVMIERSTVGGTCVNVGCIPSKALLAAADARFRAGEDRFPGIRTSAGPVDLAALVASKDELVQGMRRDKYVDIAKDYGIEIVEGNASFVAGPALRVGDRQIDAAHFLVASGARPALPDIEGLADSGYLTSTTAMDLRELPQSMVIIGGGYVAMEQAQLFAHLGTDVTMLVRSTLAPAEEPEVRDVIRAAFQQQGITVLEGVTADQVHRTGTQIVTRAKAMELHTEQVMVATGRRPNTDDLATSNPRVWGAGDVTGHPQYVYVAAKHGGIVVGNAFDGAGVRVDYRALPRITFTTPTIASAGLTEAQALAQGHRCDCRVLNLEHVPRALVSRNTHGLVKLVADADIDRILGAHIVGDGAGDVILAASLAIEQQMSVKQLASGWNPYLTLGEGLHLAAQAFTRDPSKLSCCAA
jgi:mercuric reductase